MRFLDSLSIGTAALGLVRRGFDREILDCEGEQGHGLVAVAYDGTTYAVIENPTGREIQVRFRMDGDVLGPLDQFVDLAPGQAHIVVIANTRRLHGHLPETLGTITVECGGVSKRLAVFSLWYAKKNQLDYMSAEGITSQSTRFAQRVIAFHEHHGRGK